MGEALLIGDPAPWFRQRCTTQHGDYTFDMSAGRYVVLYLYASSRDPLTVVALDAVRARRALFDDRQASFFGVSADTDDADVLAAELPGIRHFLDADGAVGSAYGGSGRWYLLDPMLRVRGAAEDGPGIAERVLDTVAGLPRVEEAQGPAPVLLLDEVFEPEFCARLIAYLRASGTSASGMFTADSQGRTQAVLDTGFKRRRDCTITDAALAGQVQARLVRRVVPQIRRAFAFEATRMDRLLLAAYAAEERGAFGAHRDNTVPAAAHRRFAVSINLNEDFEGGELIFPEFGRTRYRPAAGGAAVFSCSLLHAVLPVTRGVRFACLPFVFDEAAVRQKSAGLHVPVTIVD